MSFLIVLSCVGGLDTLISVLMETHHTSVYSTRLVLLPVKPVAVEEFGLGDDIYNRKPALQSGDEKFARSDSLPVRASPTKNIIGCFAVFIYCQLVSLDSLTLTTCTVYLIYNQNHKRRRGCIGMIVYLVDHIFLRRKRKWSLVLHQFTFIWKQYPCCCWHILEHMHDPIQLQWRYSLSIQPEIVSIFLLHMWSAVWSCFSWFGREKQSNGRHLVATSGITSKVDRFQTVTHSKSYISYTIPTVITI